MQLSKRLQAVFEMVGKTGVLGDVGTDHAYLPIALYNKKKVNRVIVSDVNSAPLETAKRNVREALLESAFSFRLGDGLKPYKEGEVDVFVIAGMGGNLIIDIIKESILKARGADFLVLQPMKNQKELRKFLNENSFSIVDEIVVKEDHRYYQIIKVENKVQRKLTDIELDLGLNVRKDVTYFEFVSYKKSKYQEIIKNRSISDKNLDSSSFVNLIRAIDNDILVDE